MSITLRCVFSPMNKKVIPLLRMRPVEPALIFVASAVTVWALFRLSDGNITPLK